MANTKEETKNKHNGIVAGGGWRTVEQWTRPQTRRFGIFAVIGSIMVLIFAILALVPAGKAGRINGLAALFGSLALMSALLALVAGIMALWFFRTEKPIKRTVMKERDDVDPRSFF